MKTTVPLLLIAIASAKAGAFQAKIDTLKLAQMPDTAVANVDLTQPLATAEVHAALLKPVSGCQCPFCTQMRALAG